ncbi:hypothetical protein HXX76_000210 [Chlamydomonas incerta]|uniref:Protein kinase domain-containing protein n=1 Tax=Chlamydomonas incerta TaxID=51695 RepID=A0A836B2Q6_CHLIN|nr:hypothetical protein HXX76_000210 [Chlamydomonas incerta]|eukprot:KAG2445599.1 hypothetical protein HXX76_000210 [Chlamydomonas incerta]
MRVAVRALRRCFNPRLRALQALTLLAAVLVNSATAAASGECSAVGGGTPSAVQALSSLSAGQVAQGALATPITAKWDFEGRPNVLAVPSGTAVSLSCLTALNATVAAPSAAAGSVFLQPTALDLSAASGLSMAGVSLSTDCGTVLAYQQYLCTSLRAAGSLTMDSGVVRFSRWRDGFTSLDNVTLTCPTSAGVAAAAAPCRLVSVQTAAELLEAFTVHAAAAAAAGANLTIVLAGNVTVPRSARPSTAATLPVSVLTNVSLVGSALLGRPVLDLQLQTRLWDVGPTVWVTLSNLTCANLAPTYIPAGLPYSRYGLLSDRVWAFSRSTRQVIIHDCTLVKPPDELSYTRLGPAYPLLPPVDLEMKRLQSASVPLTSVNQANSAPDLLLALDPHHSTPDDSGQRWVLLVGNTSTGEAGGAAWANALEATTTGDNANSTDGSSAEAEAARAAGFGDATAIIPGSTMIDCGYATGVMRLGLGGQTAALGVPAGAGLVMRRLVLSELAARGSSYSRSDPLAVLSSPLWGVSLAAGASKTQLINCTLLVSAEELWLLQQALLPAEQLAVFTGNASRSNVSGGGGNGTRRSFDAALVGATRSFFTNAADLSINTARSNATVLRIASATTDLYTLSNCVFRAPVVAYGEAAGPNLTALGVPYDDGSGGGSSGGGGAPVGAIVGGVVGGCAVLAAAATAALLFVRRRRQQQPQSGRKPSRGAGADAATVTGDDPYAQYLQRSAATDGAGGGAGTGPHGTDQVTGSTASAAAAAAAADGPRAFCNLDRLSELTDSDQVMRPGARSSAADVAGLAMVFKGGAGPSVTPSTADRTSMLSCSGPTGEVPRLLAGLMTPAEAASGAQPGVGSAAGLRSSQPSSSASSGLLKMRSPYTTTGAVATMTSAALAAAEASALRGSGLPVGGSGGALTRAPTDSFDAAPSTTTLRQHGLAGTRAGSSSTGPPPGGADCGHAPHPAAPSAAPDTAPSTDTAPGSREPAAPTAGGNALDSSNMSSAVSLWQVPGAAAAAATRSAGALNQMHAMIAAFGRNFNDQQLQVHGLIGKGAHGTVYRGTWRGLPVAVKSMVFGPDDHVRHQQRPLMEAAISSNLVHPNIVTTYSYELREVQHELASLSPELSQQGGGWRLLIIQEFCDAGPLRRLVDCGFFLTPPKPHPQRAPSRRLDLDQQRVPRKSSAGASAAASGEGGAEQQPQKQPDHSAADRGSRNGSAKASTSDDDEDNERVTRMLRRAGGTFGSGLFEGCERVKPNRPLRPALEDVPADVAGGRPASALQAALRYVEAALQIARGLQHIHDKNIVHGDLNPNNVLLVRAPGTALGFCLKVSDFGLSVRVGEGQSHLSNLFQGTPYYCAPEVMLSGKVGKSADLYSLGIMLWELQNGTRPPWRMGVRLRTYPSLNTGELEFGPDTPPRYARLARECFHASSALAALNTSTRSVWDFGNTLQALTAPAGTAVSLSCLTALNATVAAPSAAAGSVFLQPTALDLSAASGLSMAGVSLSTDCGTVLAHQQYLCTSLRAAGSLTMDSGVVRFSRWRDGFTSLDNVTLTCPTSAGVAAAAAPCRLVSVQTATELLEAFTVHAAAAAAAGANLTIVLAGNVSINGSAWPADTPVRINGNITLVGSARLRRPILDLGRLTGIWIMSGSAYVLTDHLTLANLAPAYYKPGYNFSKFGPLAERVRAIYRTGKQVFIRNCTLVVPPAELSYTRYWLTYLVSPVPEARAKADWLAVNNISVAAVNSSGVYYRCLNGRTTIMDNVQLTDSLGPDYRLLPAPSGFGQLQANSVPLVAANSVTNASDVQLALLPNNTIPDDQGRRWVLLVNNISLAAPGQWPQGPAGNTTTSSDAGVGLEGTAIGPGGSCEGGDCDAAAAPAGNETGAGVQVPGLTVIASLIPEQPVRLGLGWRLSALGVPGGGGAGLMVRNLVLSELAARGRSYSRSDPLAVLSSPMWGVSLAAGASKTRLENCTLVVSAEELWLLQQSLLPADQLAALARVTGGNATANSTAMSGSPRRPFDAALAVAARAFFTVGDDVKLGAATASRLMFVTGSAARFSMSNVTFRTPDPGSGEQASAGLTALGVPYDDGSNGSSSSGGGGAPVGAIVGGVVGGCILLLVGGAACLTVRMRRRRRRRDRYQGKALFGSDLEQPGGSAPAAAGAQSSASGEGSARQAGSIESPAGPVTATDSFNRPPTLTVSHHAPRRPGQSQGSGVAPLQRSGGSSGAVGASAAAAGSTTVSEPRPGSQSQPRGAALEQMRGTIAALGRDFAGDQQLHVHGIIGKGAYGTVYRGTWRGLPVAVKSMVFGPDDHVRHQQRPLMEAAISSHLMHPNIVTTYSYELREVQHELASLSPELFQQGGGWRLLIIQEFCDAGPLRRLVDCGFFLTPPRPAHAAAANLAPSSLRTRFRLPSVSSLLRRDAHASPSSLAPAAPPRSRASGSSSSNKDLGEASRGSRDNNRSARGGGGAAAEGDARVDRDQGGGRAASAAATAPDHPYTRPLLEDVPADVAGGRPASSLQAALRYMEAALQIARGLQHIHDKNIVHGDLNPNNVLLVRAPGTALGFCLKVSDFGLSVRVGEGQSHLSNLFQGTPYYCAPEVILSGKVGKTADLYSLGIMLWELQNGTRPPWRMGVRLRTYPSLNTGELEFGPDTPPRIWDFGNTLQALTAPAGTAVSLSCLTALNATVAAPSAAAGSVFLQPTALDLSAASGLSMAGVSLSTDCGTVLAYQQYLCTSLRAAGSLTMDSGVVRFSRWRDGFTSLDNVTLTCPTSAGVAAAAVPCRLVSVQTAAELLEAFTVHAAAAAAAGSNLTIVLAGNVSINGSVWPVSSPIVVDGNVTLVASPRLARVIVDLGQLTDIWNLTRAANVEFHNVTLVNLAPAYPNPPSYGLFTSRINAFIRTGKQLFLRNVTSVVPPEEVSYLRYWVTFLVSPVPEAHAKADWLLIPSISIAAVNASGVYYAYQNGRTTIFDNLALVDSLGPDYPLSPSPSGLGQLQVYSVPLTAMNAATNAQDVQVALLPNRTKPDDQGRRWVLLVNNISLAAPGQWPQGSAGNTTTSSDAGVGLEGTTIGPGGSCEGGDCDAAAAPAGNETGAGVQVPGLTVIASLIPEQPVRLGLGWRLSALGVPGGGGAGLVVRNLVLSELTARGSSYSRSDPLAVLSSPLWGVSLAGGASKTRLENCTLVVSAEELRLLQQALLPAEQLAAMARATGGNNATANSTGVSGSPRRPFDAALAAAARAFFTVGGSMQLGATTASRLVFVTGSAARFSMSNVTFRTPDPGSGEQASAGLTALGVPYDDGSNGSSSSGGGGAPVGAIVGGVVGGCILLLVVGGAAWLTVRTRRRRRGKYQGKALFGSDLEQPGGSAPAAAGARSSASGEGAGGDGTGREMPSGLSETQRRRQLQSSLTGSSPMLPSVGAGRASLEMEAARAKGAAKGLGGPGDSAATQSGSGAQSVPTSAPSATGCPAGLIVGAAHVGGQEPSWGAGIPGIQVLLAGEADAAHPTARYATMTDSFNRPPTLTMSGLAMRRPGQSGSGAEQAQRGGGSSGAATALAGSSTTGSEPRPGSQSRSGRTALEQMRGTIAALGRDFAGDQQLHVHGHIGEGAHGTVYRGAWHGLPVAVKSMVFGPDDHVRHQQRPLMEAAISSHLMHPNIVTTYTYELREVQHELASLSPELSQQGGGWRLLIIQEFCDAGPLRRLVDCGFFLTPPRPDVRSEVPALARFTPSVPALVPRNAGADAPASPASIAPAAPPRSRVSTSTDTGMGEDSRGPRGHGPDAEGEQESTRADRDQGGGRAASTAATAPDHLYTRPLLEDVPADVAGGRPASSLHAAMRYVEAALQISRGLQHIHDKNIVHGDLNPNNVLLVRAPGTALGFCLKVSDFGLSVHVGEGQSHLSNLFQGTPYYCAPEVILSGKVGKSADLYSLGIMLWELQNGTRPPWRMGVRLRTYPSLNTGELEFGPDTPPRYARLARECFHSSSAVRPSVESVVAALERLKEELAARDVRQGPP